MLFRGNILFFMFSVKRRLDGDYCKCYGSVSRVCLSVNHSSALKKDFSTQAIESMWSPYPRFSVASLDLCSGLDEP